jgi:hypothetical protein
MQSRGILIVGDESALFSALAAEAGKRVEHFALAPIRAAETATLTSRPQTRQTDASLQAALTLDWNPASPISARALSLGLQNRLGRLDEAILVSVPPALPSAPESMEPSLIETIVQEHIKSWFYLVRELRPIFQAKGAGTLIFCLVEKPGARSAGVEPELLGSVVTASFKALASGLLGRALSQPYQTLGFSFEPGQESAAAAFVFKTVEEANRKNNGRWLRLGASRLSIFNR